MWYFVIAAQMGEDSNDGCGDDDGGGYDGGGDSDDGSCGL